MLLAQKPVQVNVQSKPNYAGFDLERMKLAVNSTRTKMPKGLSREEKRKFLSGK